MLHRQPANPYDSNAVQVCHSSLTPTLARPLLPPPLLPPLTPAHPNTQVLNASGIQVGHIPRQVAARIAPLMDGRLINVEGRMVGQNLDRAKRYKLPM